MKRYYPWLMAIMGMLILLTSNGLIVTGLTAFDESLLKEFDWTRSQLKMRDLITLVLAGWLGPFIGAVIDKAGPRRLILSGIALLGAMYFAYAFVQSLTHLYLIHVGMGVVLVAAGLNVAVIYVSQWFSVQRGTAIGIALVGTSLGGMIFPPLAVHLLKTMDWRTAFMWEMAIPATFLVIAYFLVHSPKEVNIKPWGADKVAAKAVADAAANIVTLPDLTYQQALRTRTFWALAIVAMTTFFSIMAVSQNLFLHMRDLQFTPVQAGSALSLMFGLAMVGKFLFGMLADVLSAKVVFMVNLVIMACGAAVLATMRPDLVWYSLMLFGLGWGGLYTMIQLLAVNAFGLSSAGKILGTVTLLDATTAGLGIWMAAKIFDLTGSYKPAFQLVFVLICVALVMSTLVRDERARLARLAH